MSFWSCDKIPVVGLLVWYVLVLYLPSLLQLFGGIYMRQAGIRSEGFACLIAIWAFASVLLPQVGIDRVTRAEGKACRNCSTKDTS